LLKLYTPLLQWKEKETAWGNQKSIRITIDKKNLETDIIREALAYRSLQVKPSSK